MPRKITTLHYMNEYLTDTEIEYISEALANAIYNHPDFQKNYPNCNVANFSYNITIQGLSVEKEEE
jgi:hypothetical protein